MVILHCIDNSSWSLCLSIMDPNADVADRFRVMLGYESTGAAAPYACGSVESTGCMWRRPVMAAWAKRSRQVNFVPGTVSDIAQRRIVAAWAEVIGAPAEDFHKSEWAFVEREDLEVAVVVRVAGHGLAAAPLKALNLLRCASPEALLDVTALTTSLPAGADPIGSADLLFTESSPQPSPVGVSLAVPADVAELRDQVGASEWEESGVEDAQRRWAARTPEGRPAAVAGFNPWGGALAHMAVLASPRHRGAGFAYAAAAFAIHEALADGLIPQWRSRQGNASSLGLAQRLGFTQLGAQVAVALNG